MAVVKGICCVIPMYFFVCCFASLAVFVHLSDAFANPSSNSLDILSLDGSSYDLPETFYHVHKRAANVSTKKAVDVKKIPIVKSILSGIHKASVQHVIGNSSVIGDVTTPTTTVILSNSTSGTNLPEDKYNASVSSTLPPLAASSTSSSVTSTPITTSTIASSSTASAPSVINTTNDATTAASPKAASPLSTASSDVLPTRPPDVKNMTEDHHVYYNSSLILEEKKAMSYRVDFDKLPVDKVVVHRMLSDSHRRAATVVLSFDFPFYGHPVRNITIATGGFLYMGDYVHSWLAATQYIAPLMANFDNSLSNESTVRYFDNGTAFVVEWNNVSLQDVHLDEKFTFQAILMINGDIIFVYESIPLSVTEIGDEQHPVKVGLSDAYVIDKIIYFIRRKTIYEYHRIDMKRDEVSNHTAIYFTALPTCLSYQDCESCMAANISLSCVWCDAVKRCSDGFDRKRQDWLHQRCDAEQGKVDCSLKPSPNLTPFVQPLTDTPPKTYTFPTISSNDILLHPSAPVQEAPRIQPGKTPNYDDEISQSAQVDMRRGNFSIGGVVAVLLLVAIAVGILAWVGYAYRNPHTSSGQLLIKYRPTQWRFRSGEARYTAASVHM